MLPRPRLRPTGPQDEAPIDPGAIVRFGTIVSVFLGSAECEVECGDVRTARIPFFAGRAGATRIWSPPTVGEQVLLVCPGGDIEAAVAVPGIPQDAFPPPGNTLRELIEFSDGAQIAYDPEGHSLEALLPAGATARIEASGGITLIGDIAIDGTLSVTKDVSIDGQLAAAGDVKAGNISLKTHIHSGVTSGGATSGAPQ